MKFLEAGYWKSEHPDVHSYLLLEKGRGIQAEVTAGEEAGA